MRVAVTFLAYAVLAQAASLPAWLREAAAQPVPIYPPKVSTVVLLQEEHLTVAPDGRRIVRERGAIKLLQRDRVTPSAYRQ